MIKKQKRREYLKIVEWSDEDGCFVGTAPGLMIGGVHGKSQEKVFKELCQVVNEVLKTMEKEGQPHPSKRIKRDYSGKIALRISPELHRALVIKAVASGESVNKYIKKALSEKI